MVAQLTIAELQTLLENKSDELASIPGVVDWGVGLSSESRPLVQIFTSTNLDRSVGQRLDRWFRGQMEVVGVDGPAQAH